MPYRSRHSGAQIDAAVDAVQAAIDRMQLWYNQVIKVTAASWNLLANQEQGKYVFPISYQFSEINQYPMVYFILSNGQLCEATVIYTHATNTIRVFSNIKAEGTLIISSGSGYKE